MMVSTFRRRFPAFRAMISGMLLATFSLGILGTVGCRPTKEASSKPTALSAESGPKRYALKGEILGVSKERERLIVKHEPIEGYMPAMTMEFMVSPGDLQNAREGQRITAEMVAHDGGDFSLEKIWPADPAAVATVAAGTAALLQDTTIRGRSAYREVGETTPDFVLYDQSGDVVRADRFRGKQVLFNFVFTRCPVATMCPAAVARFQQVQKKAKESGVENLELVSISLDPEFDTPGVLRDYVNARGIDTTNYHFLTGPDKAIKALLKQFGVLAEFKGDLLNHTLATLLVNESGKIVWRADGSSWTVDEFVRRMAR